MDQSLASRLEDYLAKRGISLNKAAAAIGYTASVLSQWKRNEYKGDIEGVETKVLAWLDLQESRDESGVVPFVPLRRTTRIKTSIRIAHEEKFIGLILGNSGTGKSRALDEYSRENPNTVLLVKADPTMKLETVIAAIASGLGLNAAGRAADTSDRIVQELRKRDMAVLVDEADYLSDGTMEWLRIAVNDKGGAALVLAGLPRLEYRIKNLRADHCQLENRVGILLMVPDPDPADIREILASVWADLDEATLLAFQAAARKSLHRLIRHIAMVRRYLRSAGQDRPGADLTTEAASTLPR